MTQTKYPISKIRSGKVAVKLTDFDQFKKIAPERDLQYYEFKSYYRADYYHGYLANEFQWIPFHFKVEYTLIDFSQIVWEEVKEETDIVDIILKHDDGVEDPNSFSWQVEAKELRNQLSTLQSTIDQLQFQLKAADAENERLKEESEKLKSENEEVYRQLKLREFPNPSQNQELSLRQRMAWELYVSGFNHGIADKWTIAECYRSANIFLNYKGGDDGQ